MAGAQFADGALGLPQQTAAGAAALLAAALESGGGEVLAGRAVGEEVDGLGVAGVPLGPVHLAHVAEIAVFPLREEGVVGGDGVAVNLAPGGEVVGEAEAVEGEGLAVVAGE